MIIEKIYLENFLCYSGSNTFEFKEGINVVIGDNGYGKSKLFDAFYWVLYDRIFISEKKEFQSTEFLKSKIISDKCKFEKLKGTLSAIVRITFLNDINDKDEVFILERKYSLHFNDDRSIENNNSELTIIWKELSYLNGKVITDEAEKKKIINKILPPSYKEYLWFQGEQVESIIDFNDPKSLENAVNNLSNMHRFDELKKISKEAADAVDKEYDTFLRKVSKDKNRSLQLESEKTKVEDKISGLRNEEIELNENLSRAEARCEELLNKQADAQKVSELQERKRGVLNLLNQLNESLKEEQVSFHRKMFRNKWVLKGTSELQKSYAKKFSDYEQKKLELIAQKAVMEKFESQTAANLQIRLPFNVPEPNYLEWMLDKERCLVCDREAKKDTDAWKSIKELLDRPNNKPKLKDDEPLFVQDFTDDLKRLYQNGLSLSSRIAEIDDDINETLERRNNLNAKVRSANMDLETVEGDIQKLLSDTSLTSNEAGNILNEYSIQNKKAKDFKDDLNKVTQQIEHCKNNLKSVNEQLKSLVTGEIPKWLIEKRDVLNDFEEIAKTTRERVFNNLISQLEKEANLHYEAMTFGNKSARGQIKLRKLPNGNFMPEIIDNQGVPLLGSNTSNLILVKLSVIMAIISAKSSAGVVNLYTLITDAPTSVFGEAYTIGFCKTISTVYRQSIIMSKEFYKNQELRNELLTNPEIKIGNVYTVTPSIPESERVSRINLSTKIELLN